MPYMPLISCPHCQAIHFEHEPRCPSCLAENLRSAKWSPEAIRQFEHENAPPLEISKITVRRTGEL